MSRTRHALLAQRIAAALLALVLLGAESIAGLCAIDCLRAAPATTSVPDGAHHCGAMETQDDSARLSSAATCSQHANARLTIGAVATRLSHAALPAPAGGLLPPSVLDPTRVLLASVPGRDPAPPRAPLPLRI